jgi:hypothetical protein
MYGMVNRGIEQMVVLHHGVEMWERIKKEAGVDVEMFISNEAYADEMTFQLVGAASSVLNVPVDALLRAFGEHWVLRTAEEGYGGLMRAGGSSLVDFLLNLPNFHTRVVMMFPNLQPPRFECTEVTPNSLHLHYRTHRSGLTEFVVGLVQGLGKRFGTEATATVLASKANGADHDVFLVEWKTQEA